MEMREDKVQNIFIKSTSFLQIVLNIDDYDKRGTYRSLKMKLRNVSTVIHNLNFHWNIYNVTSTSWKTYTISILQIDKALFSISINVFNARMVFKIPETRMFTEK